MYQQFLVAHLTYPIKKVLKIFEKFYSFLICIIDSAAIPSPFPIKPIFSFVVALIEILFI